MCHHLITQRHAFDGILDVINSVLVRGCGLSNGHADPLPGRAGEPLDGLELCVEDRQCEVPFRIGQAGRIVGLRRPAQGQVALALHVRQQRITLPGRATLEEVPGSRHHHVVVLSDEQLLPFGEP